MSWDAKLEFVPVVTPDGRELITLADARAWLLEHLNDTAAGAILKAAGKPNQFYLHCARQAVSRAVHGTEPAQRSARAPTWRDKRKARRA